MKLKIKLGLIAPLYQVTPNGQIIPVASPFLRAFQKLCADPVAITDRFRLAKTENIFTTQMQAYEKARHGLITRLGVKQSELLKRELAALDAGEKDARRRALQKRIDAIAKNPELDGLGIDETNAEASKEFQSEMQKLHDEEFETDLSKKVELRDASKLTASEIALLLDLVEVAEEPVAAN